MRITYFKEEIITNIWNVKRIQILYRIKPLWVCDTNLPYLVEFKQFEFNWITINYNFFSLCCIGDIFDNLFHFLNCLILDYWSLNWLGNIINDNLILFFWYYNLDYLLLNNLNLWLCNVYFYYFWGTQRIPYIVTWFQFLLLSYKLDTVLT
jgi:hypothetical protein